MSVLHQALPILHRRDAVGAHTMHVRDLLRARGVESEIFVGITDPQTASQTTPIASYRAGPVLYQYAVTSTIVDELLARADVLAVDSHNSTPAGYFARWDPSLFASTAGAGRDLVRLRPRVDHAFAVSSFNARQLQAMGYPRCSVVPVLFRTLGHDGAAPHDVDVHRWLFVGRIVPNKCQHDLITALATARRHVDPDATLVLAGAASSAPYEASLRRLCRELGVENAVHLTGPVNDAELVRLYASSGVYVSVSEHEGFGVPLVEAMSHGLPVVAYGVAAISETVAEGGIVLDTKRPLDVALAAWAASQPDERRRLIRAGLERARHFDLEHTGPAMWGALQPLLDA